MLGIIRGARNYSLHQKYPLVHPFLPFHIQTYPTVPAASPEVKSSVPRSACVSQREHPSQCAYKRGCIICRLSSHPNGKNCKSAHTGCCISLSIRVGVDKSTKKPKYIKVSKAASFPMTRDAAAEGKTRVGQIKFGAQIITNGAGMKSVLAGACNKTSSWHLARGPAKKAVVLLRGLLPDNEDAVSGVRPALLYYSRGSSCTV